MAAGTDNLFDRLFQAREAIQSLHWNYESVRVGEWYSVHKLTDDVLATLDNHIDVVGETLLATTRQGLLSGSKQEPILVTDPGEAAEKLQNAIKTAKSFINASDVSIATRVAVEDMIKDLEVKHWLLSAGVGNGE